MRDHNRLCFDSRPPLNAVKEIEKGLKVEMKNAGNFERDLLYGDVSCLLCNDHFDI